MHKFFEYKTLKMETLVLDNHRQNNLIFAHGFGSSFKGYEKMLQQFSSFYNVYALNMPAHGQSQFNKKVMNLKSFADILCSWIEKMDLKNITLVAHSMGSAIALASVKRLKKRLKKLVLISPLFRRKSISDEKYQECFFANPDVPDSYKNIINVAYYDEQKALNNDLIVSKTKQYVANNYKNREHLQPLGISLGTEKTTKILIQGIKYCKAPIYVILGEGDKIVDIDNIENFYHEYNQDAKFYVVPKAGHSMWIENLAGFLEKFQTILKS